MRLLVAVATAVSFVLPVEAQESAATRDTVVLVPGGPSLDPARLVPHRATWRVTRHEPDGGTTNLGLWTDTWTRSTEQERPIVLFQQLFVDTAGAVQWLADVAYDAATFRALHARQQFPPGGEVTYRYSGDTASGTLRVSATADPRDFRVVFEEPVWEPLMPASILWPYENAGRGTVIREPIWNQAVGAVRDVTRRHIRVDSVGTVVASGRALAAWHLTVTVEARPNTVTRLWQTPAPPYFWWFIVEQPGLVREWSLVGWEPFVPSPPRER